MEIIYLGTAAAEGWPAVFCNCEACNRARSLGGKNIRTRSQAVIDGSVMVDYPPDAYWHMVQNKLEFNNIATLLVTHSHQDHFYANELMLRGWPYAHEQKKPLLTVYGNGSVEAEYNRVYAGNDSPNIKEVIRFQRVRPFEVFTTIEGYTVTPVLANHSKKEECLLYVIEKDGKCIFYGNDSGLYPQATWEFLAKKHLNAVSFDCTNVTMPDGNYHMGLPDNREAKRRLLELGCADANTKFVVTHFSHNGKLMHEEIVEETRKDNFIVAYDGIRVTV